MQRGRKEKSPKEFKEKHAHKKEKKVLTKEVFTM